MKRNSTVEGKAKTQNGVKRLVFCGIAILLQVIFWVVLFIRLNAYMQLIDIATRIFGLILVLSIYSEEKTATVKMPWIILILVAPVLGIVLYLLIGLDFSTRNMRRRYRRVDEKIMPKLPENREVLDLLQKQNPRAAGIAVYLQDYSGYPVYRNTDVIYYDDAAKGLEAQLKDLEQAKSFIFMEYHAIENAESWRRIQDVLEDRVKAGVEVRVFYDDMGSIGFVNKDFARSLEKVGIACEVFNPFVPGMNMFLNNRDHRKITVIDGKVGFTGGYNLANEYFNITHPYGEWKDTGIRLQGDAVRSLTVTFLEMWSASRPGDFVKTDVNPYLPDISYRAVQQGFIQPYADSPMDEEQVGENVYISMANKAERYCWFVTPYLIITDEMAQALSLAAKRGVDIRILTPGIPDKKLIYSITRSFYSGLVKNGVRIFEWTPGFCHAKMSVADDTMATCGTINLDYRSLYHHFENGCFLAECDAVREIRDDILRTMDQSREVTEQYRPGKRTHLRLSQMFLRLFAELL